MDAFGRAMAQKLFDRLRSMNRRPIPDHQKVARNLAQQQAQEAHHILGTVGMILCLHQQPSIRGDCSDGGEMIIGQLDAQHRGLSTGRIGAYSNRQEVKAFFIYEDDRPFFLFGLFLSAGHRSSFHLWMAASSRWVARWTGFWTLYLMARRMRLQWAGW